MESLGATYDVYVIGSLESADGRSGLLLVLIELFARSYGWGATGENRLKTDVLQGVGQYPPDFHVEGDVPHQSFSHG